MVGRRARGRTCGHRPRCALTAAVVHGLTNVTALYLPSMEQSKGPPPHSMERNLKMVNAMWHAAWALKAAMVRDMNPTWTDEQVRIEVRRVFLLAR
jgi:hypothetical protein